MLPLFPQFFSFLCILQNQIFLSFTSLLFYLRCIKSFYCLLFWLLFYSFHWLVITCISTFLFNFYSIFSFSYYLLPIYFFLFSFVLIWYYLATRYGAFKECISNIFVIKLNDYIASNRGCCITNHTVIFCFQLLVPTTRHILSAWTYQKCRAESWWFLLAFYP